MEIDGRRSLGCTRVWYGRVRRPVRPVVERIIMINHNSDNNEMMYRDDRKLAREMATVQRYLLRNAASSLDTYVDERNVSRKEGTRLLICRDQPSDSPPGRDMTNPRRYRAAIKRGTLIDRCQLWREIFITR